MKSDYFYIAAIILVVTFAVTMVVLWTRDRKNYVNAKYCNKPLGEFGVESGYTSKDVITKCGTSGSDRCVFTNISNLSAAIKLCNDNIEICDRFSYDSSVNTLQFVKLNGKYTSLSSSDMYTRQYNS